MVKISLRQLLPLDDGIFVQSLCFGLRVSGSELFKLLIHAIFLPSRISGWLDEDCSHRVEAWRVLPERS